MLLSRGASDADRAGKAAAHWLVTGLPLTLM